MKFPLNLPPQLVDAARQGVVLVRKGKQTVQNSVDFVRSQNLRIDFNDARGRISATYIEVQNDPERQLLRALELFDTSVRFSDTAKERGDTENLPFFNDMKDNHDKPAVRDAVAKAIEAKVDVKVHLEKYSWGTWFL